jgi:hypothetical protein
MSVASALARGRAAALALMQDTCTITYVTGTHTDDRDGRVTEQRATRYSGACRIQAPAAQGQQQDPGQATVTLLRMQLQLPVVGTEGVARGDQVTITASVGDQALVGRTWTVRDIAHKTHATSRRITIGEVT